MHHLNRYLRCLLLLLSLGCWEALAQPRLRLMEFEDFNQQVSQVSRIVRDGQGMIWFSTNDGLFRYDGYEFRNFKSRSGDGVNMPSNRITGMYPSSDGSLWCLISGRLFLFDTRTYYYIDVLADYERQQGRTYHISKIRPLPCGTTFAFTDDGLVLALQDAHPASTVKQMADHEPTDGMTVMCDGQQRSWVLTARHTYVHRPAPNALFKRFDQTFWRVISTANCTWLLTSDGKLSVYDEQRGMLKPWTHPQLTSPIIGFTALADKNVVLCTRDGLLLLSPDGRRLTKTAVTAAVSKVVQDKYGHLWLLGDDGRLTLTDCKCQQAKAIEGIRMDDFNLHADKYGTLWFFADNGDTYYAYSDDPAHLYRYDDQGEGIGKIRNTIYDEQGGSWFLRRGLVCRLTFESQHFKRLPMHKADQVRSVIVAQERLFVTTRNEADISVYSLSGNSIGWLGRDGRISASWQSFGAAVYSSHLDADGTLWLGTKHDGIFRLRPQADGSYQVSQFCHDEQDPQSISDNEVYGFATDQRHRLWVATRHGGLCCVADPKAETLRFTHAANGLRGWTASRDVGVKSLLALPSGLLLAGTYEGLFVADVSGADLNAITFKGHWREASRQSSLSSSAITDILKVSDEGQEGSGRIFLSTEDGGINEILTKDLLADQLDFRHYDLSSGFPSDITRAMAEADGSLWVTTTTQLIELRLEHSQLPDVNTYLMSERPSFSVARPVHLGGSRWVFGAEDGALLIDLKQLKTSSFVPPLVITGVSIEGGPIDYAAGRNDTIRLSAHERDLTLWFSALDYEDTRHVVYAYRLGEDASRPWTYLGQNHSIALSQLKPGTYHMTIRSTNSDGVWAGNERLLTIIVTPTFWETPWALLLMVSLVCFVTALVLYIVYYIRRLKRQQHETLEMYLALLGSQEHAAPKAVDHGPAAGTENDDALMKRLVSYVETNLGNSDLSIDDIAQACAVSRTSLHRKVKSMTGTSPMDFVREARIRKATQQLMDTTKSVSEVAYACGFTDPKYFSKCFKAITGKTPSEYRN